MYGVNVESKFSLGEDDRMMEFIVVSFYFVSVVNCCDHWYLCIVISYIFVLTY